jgi:hypothetical protein
MVQRVAERVCASHVVATDDTILPMQSKGKTANARMWVMCVGKRGVRFGLPVTREETQF